MSGAYGGSPGGFWHGLGTVLRAFFVVMVGFWLGDKIGLWSLPEKQPLWVDAVYAAYVMLAVVSYEMVPKKEVPRAKRNW